MYDNNISEDRRLTRKECEMFGHWLLDDSDTCVKCNQELDLENDGYVRLEINLT